MTGSDAVAEKSLPVYGQSVSELPPKLTLRSSDAGGSAIDARANAAGSVVEDGPDSVHAIVDAARAKTSARRGHRGESTGHLRRG